MPDPLLYTVIGLAVTQIIGLSAFAFKKLLELERLREKVDALAAKVERRRRLKK